MRKLVCTNSLATHQCNVLMVCGQLSCHIAKPQHYILIFHVSEFNNLIINIITFNLIDWWILLCCSYYSYHFNGASSVSIHFTMPWHSIWPVITTRENQSTHAILKVMQILWAQLMPFPNSIQLIITQSIIIPYNFLLTFYFLNKQWLLTVSYIKMIIKIHF